MKKLLLLLAVLSFHPVMAQDIEVLDSVRVERDELTGEQGVMVLQSRHVVIQIADNGLVKWHLRNPPHVFVGDRFAFTGTRKPTCKAKLGIYDSDGNLLVWDEGWKGYPSESGRFLDMYVYGKVTSKRVKDYEASIIDVINTTKTIQGSYVRIVVPVYADAVMDIKFRIPDRWYIQQ